MRMMKMSVKYNNWKGLGFLTHRQGLWPEQCRTNMISAGMCTYTNVNLKNHIYQITVPCNSSNKAVAIILYTYFLFRNIYNPCFDSKIDEHYNIHELLKDCD